MTRPLPHRGGAALDVVGYDRRSMFGPRCRCGAEMRHLETVTHDENILYPAGWDITGTLKVNIYECPRCRNCCHYVTRIEASA